MTGPTEAVGSLDLHSNAYRSLPGGQDVFSLLFSCNYIHRNSRE